MFTRELNNYHNKAFLTLNETNICILTEEGDQVPLKSAHIQNDKFRLPKDTVSKF